MKGSVDFNTRSELCVRCSNHEKIEENLNSSWTQKLKQVFESRRATPAHQADIEAEIIFNDETREEANKTKKNEKIITYNFEHGCPEYYKTFDCPPHLLSDVLAEQTVQHATRFWAEMFGFINIGVTFFVTFLLQFYR